MLNCDVRKKENEHSTSKACMIRIICNAERLMYPWKPCCRRRGPPRTRHFLIPISWHAIYTAAGLYCSLACDASHVTWSDRRPGYIAQFRNLISSLQARRAAGMGVYTTVL